MDDYLDNAGANTREYILMKRAEDGTSPSAPLNGNCPNDFSRDDTGLHLHVLASGSKGNATVVESRSTALLIDCGIPKKTFLAACDTVGFDPAKITAVFVTHEHSDHTKGLGVSLRGLTKLGCSPTVYTTAGTYESSSELGKLADSAAITTIVPGQSLVIGDMTIQTFSTSHDAADPIGFAIETFWHDNRDVLGYLTDSGYLPDACQTLFSGARLLAIESNHDCHMLDIGPYPTALKRRVASDEGHLSNDQAAEGLESLLSDHLETAIGMHLSETNNLPHLARSSLTKAVKRSGSAATVFTAYQHRPVSIG